MATVKLGLSDKRISYIITYCSNIVNMMTGNVIYDTPNPSLKVVSVAIDALNQAYNAALRGGTDLKAAQRLQLKTLLETMKQLAAYVQNASGGDKMGILSSGMEVRETRGSKEPPATPQNLRFKLFNLSGEANLMWGAVKRKTIYVMEQSQTPAIPSSWVQVGLLTRASMKIEGLSLGQTYSFRVAAKNCYGQSDWSQPASKMIS